MKHPMLWYCVSGAAFGLMFAMLLGCAAPLPPEPVVRTITINVPVPVTCVPSNVVVMPPDYPDKPDAIAKAGIQMRAQIVVAANIILHDRNDVLEQVLKTCLKAGAVPAGATSINRGSGGP